MQLRVPLAEPYRVDGDPVSRQAESVASPEERWAGMVPGRRWQIWHAEEGSVSLMRALDEQWEPFAVWDGTVYLRKQFWNRPFVPLPPQ